ncbi:MAG: 1-acyl-sn-glycerol-3-phosphate acyltransferase [Planctomycetes bacterium]|nr:1-acyl-sn-glycerol-3-phosphate acyltransferase [Planctomycetota bacterium]
MNDAFYNAGRLACRFIKFQCVREVVLHRERVDRPGGLLLACTHISHLEPIVVAAALRRKVRWMARIEFYEKWWGAAMLHRGGAFPVDRYGFTLPAVRRAVQLVREGEVVGLFPEGGVAKGRDSLLRGGAMKHGVCTIALRTNTPIVPVVVLGTEKLNRVNPWLPPRRARLYMAFGSEVVPPARRVRGPLSNRTDRLELAERLRAAFVATYQELLAHTGLTDSEIP